MPGRRGSPWLGCAAAGLAAAGVLTAAGCSATPDPVGSGPAPSASASPNPAGSTSASVSSDRPVAPLTGLPADSTADASRPAVALDVSGAHPQGLGSADVVFQEISSPVRYIAVYQFDESAKVGPITATEPTDRGVLNVLHPLLGYDGAAAPFLITLLDKTKIVDASYSRHPAAYTSGPGGITTTAAAVARAVRGAGTPPQLFIYRGSGAGGDTLAGSGVSRWTSVRVTLPGAGTQHWTFDQHTNQWSLASGGPSVRVANLIIQSVRYSPVKVSAKHGVSMTQAGVVGSGRVEAFSGSVSGGTGGTGASGTWSKPHSGLITNYFGSSGTPMAFDPGRTWVILAPPGTHVSTAGD